ncbi:MAG: hypothetical protein M0R40_03850 [Firmicutes bacterium]|nr:hypothetical protein [Bacillota bacterium]
MQSIIKLNCEEQPQSCAVCVYSRPLSGLAELSCSKKGVVSPDYVCKKFSLDITAKSARKKRFAKKVSAEDFEY